MSKFGLFGFAIVFVSCSVARQPWYFESSDWDNATLPMDAGLKSQLDKSEMVMASSVLVFDESKRVILETARASDDSTGTINSGAHFSTFPSTKAKKGELQQKKITKEPVNAKRTSAGAPPKNENRNGFALAGLVLIILAFVAISNPATAAVLAVFGVVASILGLKSKMWRLSIAVLIATGVMLSIYLFMYFGNSA